MWNWNRVWKDAKNRRHGIAWAWHALHAHAPDMPNNLRGLKKYEFINQNLSYFWHKLLNRTNSLRKVPSRLDLINNQQRSLRQLERNAWFEKVFSSKNINTCQKSCKEPCMAWHAHGHALAWHLWHAQLSPPCLCTLLQISYNGFKYRVLRTN